MELCLGKTTFIETFYVLTILNIMLTNFQLKFFNTYFNFTGVMVEF